MSGVLAISGHLNEKKSLGQNGSAVGPEVAFLGDNVLEAFLFGIFRTFKHRIIRLAEFASFQLYSTRFETEWLPFSPYLELPPELADVDADKDNISSESGEAISLSSGVSGHTSGLAINKNYWSVISGLFII